MSTMIKAVKYCSLCLPKHETVCRKKYNFRAEVRFGAKKRICPFAQCANYNEFIIMFIM